jgi:polyhydroxybutyrate depolymerase
VEPAPVTAPTIKWKGQRAIGAVLALFSLPLLLVLVEAVSFRVANRPTGSFISLGRKREYVLYVPTSYDPAKPTALVISLHGAALWGAAQRETSQWDRVADEHGFIVVYPSGEAGGGPRVWHEGVGAEPSHDVRFISELIDTLEARYNIDPRMIYANGLSNGGGMSFALSCALSDRIAAVGMVGAALLLPFRWCTDQRPVPMIAFHGTADRAAPYQGGFSWVAPRRFPGVRAFTASWARRNRCGANPVDSVVAPDVTRLEYTKCADDAAVVLYTIKGGGHTWPGGQPLPEWFVGRTSNSIDASSLMWAFFRAHRLTARVD